MAKRDERLREARTDAEFGSARAAAIHHGWTESTYRSHENGTRPFDKRDAAKYAVAFGVSFEWLYHGRGQKTDSPPAESRQNVKPAGPLAPSSGRMLPVYGIAAGSSRGHFILTSQIVDQVPCPPDLELVPNAYAVYVVNDSMEPRYFQGERLFIHPGRPVRKGDFVLAQIQIDDGGEIEPLVKRLVGITDTHYEFEQYNPPRRFSVPRDQVVNLHLVHSASIA